MGHRLAALAAVIACFLATASTADAGVLFLLQNANQYAAELTADGRGGFIAAGTTNVDPGNRNQFGLARFTKAGRVDKSFGKHGYAHVQMADGTFEDLSAVGILPSGRILVAGAVADSPGDATSCGQNCTVGQDEHYGFARFTAKGALDRSFGGGDGKAFIHGPLPAEEPKWMLVRPDGGIFAGGIGFATNMYGCAMSVDSAFGSTPFGYGCSIPAGWASAGFVDGAIDGDGVVVAASSSEHLDSGGHSDQLGIARFGPDGKPDPAFGAGGYNRVALAADKTSDVLGAAALAKRPGGGWIVGGAGPGGFSLAAYTATGQLDTSYGKGGVSVWNADATSARDRLQRLVAQPDGSVIAVGEIDGEITKKDVGKILLTRFKKNGSVDKKFGKAGRVIIKRADTGGWQIRNAGGAVAQGGSTILTVDVLVYFNREWRDVAAVLRVLPSGKLDPKFAR